MKEFGRIPVAPHALPVIGHLGWLARDPLAALSSLPHSGDLVRLRLGTADVVVVCSPDLTAQVLRDDRVFDKGGFFIDRSREIVGDGVATCPHSGHRRQRRLVQPAFHRGRMSGYGDVMADQAGAVVDAWRDGHEVDVLSEMMVITTRTILVTMFSDTLPPPVLSQAITDVRDVLSGMARRMATLPPLDRLPTRSNRRHRQAITRLREIVGTVIEARRGGEPGPDDLMSLLLSSRDHDGSRLSDEEIADQVMIFFIAGSETVASTLTWALSEVAGNPEIQSQLQEEADRVLAGSPARYEHVPQLELTGHVITETLRLWSPAWMFTRITRQDTELGGYHIPAGTTVVYSQHLLHHRDDLHAQPDRFDPGRWTAGDTKRNDTFIPFGGGPRKCIGDHFAEAESTIALASIISRWQLEHTSDQDLRPVLSAVLRPRKLRLRVTKRDKITHTHETAEHPVEA
ncbi:cytochrome P450 [Lentzea flava]|uniref:Cytochrome P450 n=1 Tax=Lentzea flava TaxID=103732 RepID=A0ABQ2VGA8_9PSEU|nr:cytochrome P450 [Lentzea flava]MCP2204773.1 pentalenene oxygenase [Lentzea flava]GGU81494.1 cytochrome P450 [Lentzea flava]